MSDIDLSRYRRDGRRIAGPADPGPRGGAFLGRVTEAAPAVGQFMKVIPRAVVGAEVSGGAGSPSDLGTTPTEVYLLGPGVPATNDEVVAQFVDYRWVTHRRVPTSGGPYYMGGCCSPGVPATITLTMLSIPHYCIPGANAGSDNDTFTYAISPPPAWSTVIRGAPSGPAWFSSTLHSWTGMSTNGEMGTVTYYLAIVGDGICRLHIWLGIVTTTFVAGTYDEYGGDSGAFFQIGAPGNTCSPFFLQSNSAAGSPACATLTG